jgi:hypothetical protein
MTPIRTSANSDSQTVKGVVMMITADLRVVKEASRKSQLLNLEKDTKIEAKVAANGQPCQ